MGEYREGIVSIPKPSDTVHPLSSAPGKPGVTVILTVYGAVTLSTISLIYPRLSRAAGLPPNAAIGLLHLPIVVAALFSLRPVIRDSLIRLLLALWGLAAMSLLWSQADVSRLGLLNVYAVFTGLAWMILLASYPALLDVLAYVLQRIIVTVAIVGLGFLAFGEGASPFRLSYTIVVAGLFSHILSRHRQLHHRQLFVWIYYLICLTLIAQSGYRAVAIGAVAGVLIAAVSSRLPVRACAVTLLVGLIVAAPFVSHERTTDPALVSRTDIVARYSLITQDRLSGRIDIWNPAVRALTALPGWSFFGVGIGDVERELFAISHWNGSELGDDGVWRTHSHNVGLEVAMATGFAGLFLLLIIMASICLRLARLRDMGMWGCWCTLLLVSLTNVPAYDLFGGALFVGLALSTVVWRRYLPASVLAFQQRRATRSVGYSSADFVAPPG